MLLLQTESVAAFEIKSVTSEIIHHRNTVFTATGICHPSYVACLLASR